MTPEAKEKLRLYMQEYRRKNKEKIRLLNKRWREKNREKIKEYQIKYWENKVKAG